jgi:hypothetical protein
VVEEDVRQVSPEIVAVGVFTIVGTLLGVVVGALIERLLRSWGRVRCEASLTQPLRLTGVKEEEPGYPRDFALEVEVANETTRAAGVSYECTVDLFNGSEVPTGLHDARIELVLANGRRLTSHPEDLGTGKTVQTPGIGTQYQVRVYDTLGVINLPSRQFVRMELRGGFGKDAADALKTGRWKRIVFEARRPKRPLLWRRVYRKTIVKP